MGDDLNLPTTPVSGMGTRTIDDLLVTGKPRVIERNRVAVAFLLPINEETRRLVREYLARQQRGVHRER